MQAPSALLIYHKVLRGVLEKKINSHTLTSQLGKGGIDFEALHRDGSIVDSPEILGCMSVTMGESRTAAHQRLLNGKSSTLHM